MRQVRANAGMSLLEVLIASLILAFVVFMTIEILISGSTAVERSGITGTLEHRGRLTVHVCSNEFVSARFRLDHTNPVTALQNLNPYPIAGISGNADLGIYASNTEIRYMLAGTQDSDGLSPQSLPPSPSIKNGQIVWGYTSPLPVPSNGFRKDLACLIRFEADTVLLESAGSPPVASQPASWGAPFPALPALLSQNVNWDIDQNGVQTDTFVRGRLRQYVVAPAGHPLGGPAGTILGISTLSDNVVLKVQGGNQFNADMDASPGSGMLFRFVDKTGAIAMSGSLPGPAATSIIMTVWHGNFDDRGRAFWVRKNSETVGFRNSQN
jgi:hypothetical protein